MSIISFASCTNDIENLDIIPTNNGQNTEGNIILQERNPNLPLPLIKKFILNKPQTRNSVSGEDRTFLGYSYKIKNIRRKRSQSQSAEIEKKESEQNVGSCNET